MWSKYPEILHELNLIDEYIRKNTASRNKFLTGVVNELVQAGGKRLRPAFVVLASKFGKYNRKKVLSIAGAIEILHTATLVHDDIIDRSKLRRGRTTVSEKHGGNMAVYTGDFLFTKAVMMLSRDIPKDKLEEVAKAIKTICEGEVDQYQEKFKINTSELSYLKRISRKTAALFGAAAGLGAYSGKCNAQTIRKLGKFGFYYGMAFQIRDDLNDFLQDEKSSGKPVGKDLMEGIITLPVIFAAKKAVVREALEVIVNKKEDVLQEDVNKVIELVKDNGGIEYADTVLKRYISRGINALKTIPDHPYKDIFIELINNLQISR